MSKECECRICKTIDKYRWATIKECPCYCHSSEGISGHDSLCCAYPNGKKKDNPYSELEAAETYKLKEDE